MQKRIISDKDMVNGFLIFSFIKTYQESFLLDFPIILRMVYENGLLSRYFILIILLVIYSLLPYLIVLTSYFIFPFFSYKQHYLQTLLGIDLQVIYLIQSIFCVLLFFWLKHLSSSNVISAITSLLISMLFIYFLSVFLKNWFFASEDVLISLVNLVYFPSILVLCSAPIHFAVIYNCFLIGSPVNGLFILKKTINFLGYKLESIFSGHYSFVFIYFCLPFLLMVTISDTHDLQVYIGLKLFLIYILICAFSVLTIAFLTRTRINNFFSRIKLQLDESSFYSLFAIFIFIICTIIIYIFIIVIKYIYSLVPDFFGQIIFTAFIFFVTCGILFIVGGILYLILLTPSLIFPHFFYNWWFNRKYFLNDIQSIFEAFNNEKISKGRLFLLQQFALNSSSNEKKLKILSEMAKNEKDEKVLDEIYKTRQTLKQEQRQAKLMSDVSPTVQDSLKNVTGFDFTDPTIENNRTANISSIDSARQQLLDWLKGETPANPSIDKLLIYQWQDYEIGIGLKYSGQMGGDFYDLFQLPTANADNQVGVVISDFGLLVGDLTGHGVETALNLSKTHNFWAETDLSQDVLTTMQAFEQNFKTTFQPFPNREGCELCYLQLKDNEITLSRAGLHLGLIRDNQWHNIAPPPHENFMALGKWPSLPVKRYTSVELKAGETLIVYTDGLYENANQNGEQFGQDNFQQLLLQQQSLDMNTLIDTVFRTVYEYCQPEPLDDDETLLVIRRKG
jgi:hypothetical protein